MCKFRNLRADEIDVRVSQIKSKFFSLLLYKDARCDMNILDETVGSMNWKREHTRENANCIVSIWDKEKQQWISKEDTGTESNTEKEKGLASDSFKRACFNWGIGRELYTSPTINIYDMSYVKTNSSGKESIYEKFKVSKIEINKDKIITYLEIVDSNGKIVFSTKKKVVKQEQKTATKEQINELKKLGYKGSLPVEQLSYEKAEELIVIGKKMKKGAK